VNRRVPPTLSPVVAHPTQTARGGRFTSTRFTRPSPSGARGEFRRLVARSDAASEPNQVCPDMSVVGWTAFGVTRTEAAVRYEGLLCHI